MTAHDKQVVRHQVYRSVGLEVVLDEIVYNPREGEDKKTIAHYLVRQVTHTEAGDLKLGAQHRTQDLQPLGRVVTTLEAA